MLKPFHPKPAATASVAGTTASLAAALLKCPSTGEFQVRIHNATAATAFVEFGTSGVVATLAASTPLPPGAVEVLTAQSTDANPITHAAAILSTGTGSVYFTTGEGI